MHSSNVEINFHQGVCGLKNSFGPTETGTLSKP